MELFAHKINFLECFAVVLKSARSFRHQQGRDGGMIALTAFSCILYFVFCILQLQGVSDTSRVEMGGRIALTALFPSQSTISAARCWDEV